MDPASAQKPEDGADRGDGANDSPCQARFHRRHPSIEASDGRGEIGTGDKVVAAVSVLCNGYEGLGELGLGACRRQSLDGSMCVERHGATISQPGH